MAGKRISIALDWTFVSAPALVGGVLIGVLFNAVLMFRNRRAVVGVEYGRTMAGTVDVKTRTDFEENGKLAWGTDILDTQLYYEDKLGKKNKFIDDEDF